MNKTVLITWWAWFIWANFVYHILNKYKNYRIVVIDKITYAWNLDNLDLAFKKNKDRISFYREDIVNTKEILTIFKKENPDFVVHFAAESHVDKSIENPLPFLMTNIIWTYSLLEAAKITWVERFHLVSTDEVFWELPLDNMSVKFTEETNYDPQNPYSASKAWADHLVRAYKYTYGMNITISNCTNNIWPYQFPEKIVPYFVLRLLHDLPLTVHGDWSNMRDYIHVADHCEWIDIVLHKWKSWETYFFSTEKETSNTEIAEAILKIMWKPKSMLTFVKDRQWNDSRYAMYYTKSKEELWWEPKHTFEESIKDTIEWYVNNEQWYKKIWQKLHKELK